MRTMIRMAALPVAILALAACNPADKADTPKEPSGETLAVALNDGHDRLSAIVNAADLKSVLEGVGPYTVFAPADAAIPAGDAFTSAETKAQGAALLRAHIVPGALTRKDIGGAIDLSNDGSVKMRTMADGMLTFRRDGDAITVTADDGATARLVGDEELVANGVVQPVDGLLLKATTASE